MQVTLYKYSNRDVILGYGDWYGLREFHIDPYQQDYHGAVTYELPEGYLIAESNSGEAEIYSPSGAHCEIVAHASGRPQLVDGSKVSPVLKVCSDA